MTGNYSQMSFITLVTISNTIFRLTYHLVTPSGQFMMPDFVLFIELSSAINYEVFFMEVKRKGNLSNNTLENDMIKLSKEMHIALNKLVVKKLRNQKLLAYWWKIIKRWPTKWILNITANTE